jgi:hypothetical protein
VPPGRRFVTDSGREPQVVTLGAVGKAALALSVGALGVLAGNKFRDARYVDGVWQSLEQAGSSGEIFTEEMVSGLPDVARRYFLHAIRPGALLASRLHWQYSGSLKPGKDLPWMSLGAEQLLAKDRGFVWKAKAWKGPLMLTATDHYLDGEGRMRIALCGLVPIVNATGPDLSKSALARFVAESPVLPPALLPGPHVQIDGIDESHFRATVSLHGETTPITLRVGQEGQLEETVLQRWGNLTPDGSYGYIPYGATALEEHTFGAYTIPTRMAGGWWYGTEQYLEVVRLSVDWAELH